MRHTSTLQAVENAVAKWRLLTHPFYQRWSAGLLSGDELREYAAQYRHIEAALPSLLERAAEGCANGAARTRIEQTLTDERGDEKRLGHLQLFDDFSDELNAAPAAATPATRALLATLDELADRGIADILSGLAAYEVQSPEVSASKAAGLRAHHGLSDRGVAFWEAHALADVEHATWTIEALDLLDADARRVSDAASASAKAWWAFLDERDAVAVH